jgi:hypothetical protein
MTKTTWLVLSTPLWNTLNSPPIRGRWDKICAVLFPDLIVVVLAADRIP